MKKITYLLASVTVLINSSVQATAIIAIILPNRILLSVDSRLTYTDNATGEKKYKTGCKLSTVNGLAFGFAGYIGFSGKVSAAYGNFKTDLFIRSVLGKPGPSLNETFSALLTGLEKQLTNQMNALRKLNHKDYLKYLNENNGNIINLVVIGNDRGIPFAFALNGRLTEVNGTALVKAEASLFENKTTIIHAGGTDAAARYLKVNGSAVQREEPIALIDKLMNLCAKDKPLAIGLPVDIAEASQGSVKWQRHQKGCCD